MEAKRDWAADEWEERRSEGWLRLDFGQAHAFSVPSDGLTEKTEGLRRNT
jgi:hypothetical protein